MDMQYKKQFTNCMQQALENFPDLSIEVVDDKNLLMQLALAESKKKDMPMFIVRSVGKKFNIEYSKPGLARRSVQKHLFGYDVLERIPVWANDWGNLLKNPEIHKNYMK